MTDGITGRRPIAVRVAMAIIVLALVAGGSLVAWAVLHGPRMWVQPNVRAFQAQVPQMPAGVVPAIAPATAPSVVEAQAMVNPLTLTPENVARGDIYYQYYCLYCHGVHGDGNGYVGQSYIPKPTDFRDPAIQTYTDGELLRAMLLGVGHAPILEQVVLPEHRWYLVLYTRYLASTPSPADAGMITVPGRLIEKRSPLPEPYVSHSPSAP
jgi:hypothetical protein